ncbi:peptidyl-prolyl cis-trans isomerase [Streptomyces sp. NPDC060198]|uniref:peptidyl-prolyl cis-trans isomerase n=1 Tax=Streptomyces sp. NPDC060198 TaxID=3347070 RepID=UPI00364D22F2
MLTGAVLALVAVVVVAVTTTGGRDGEQVATLDGRPVTRDELLFHMGRLAPTVQNELTTTYHLASPFSWNAKTGAKSALQRLETSALDEIREDRATLVLAQDHGLVDSVDFADLTAERTEENEARAQAVEAGQTVYGVTDFSLEEYYTHRLTELATKLKDLLSKDAGDPLHVTDAEVRKAFDADPDSWSANATTYAYTQLVVQVPDGAPAGFAAALQRRVDAAGHLADVTGVADAKLTTATYGGSGTTGLSTHDQDLVSVLGELDRGEVSAPVKGTGQITYYQLDSVKTDTDKAFTEYSQRIRQSLVEKKYATYLQRRADDASMHVDSSAVAAINAKDVQQ